MKYLSRRRVCDRKFCDERRISETENFRIKFHFGIFVRSIAICSRKRTVAICQSFKFGVFIYTKYYHLTPFSVETFLRPGSPRNVCSWNFLLHIIIYNYLGARSWCEGYKVQEIQGGVRNNANYEPRELDWAKEYWILGLVEGWGSWKWWPFWRVIFGEKVKSNPEKKKIVNVNTLAIHIFSVGTYGLL